MNLSFFTVDEYEFSKENICDFQDAPRPHYCVGLILEGSAIFKEECENEVAVSKGDIIFVPITSRYVSRWKSDGKIRYISLHFSFENARTLGTMKIQKIVLPDFDKTLSDFKKALTCYSGSLSEQFKALEAFYGIMAEIEPLLKKQKKEKFDSRIKKVIDFINLNSEKELDIPHLAKMSNMSVSYFHSNFKKATGMTPIEYKNFICINRAMRILINNPEKSIEEISEETGFYSSIYFRRVFKKITGRTPTEYRKNSTEL